MHSLFPAILAVWLQLNTLKLLHLETKITVHIFLHVCWFFLRQGTIACWIFSPEKKRFTWKHKCFDLLDIFNAFSSCFSFCFFLKVLLWHLCFSKNAIFSARTFMFLESHTSSTVCHFLFFVLNALLSLQTKDNHFRASALQQHFNWRDFAGNAEEQKWIRFGIGYLIFLCGQYILHCSHRPKFTCMRSNKLVWTCILI